MMEKIYTRYMLKIIIIGGLRQSQVGNPITPLSGDRPMPVLRWDVAVEPALMTTSAEVGGVGMQHLEEVLKLDSNLPDFNKEEHRGEA